MTSKRVAILALAGAALAQMDGMSEGMDSSSITTPAAAATSDAVGAATSDPTISVTDPPTTGTDAASTVPTSTAGNMDYLSTPADNYTSAITTVIVDSSVQAGSSVMTDMSTTTNDMSSMTAMSSTIETDSTATLNMGVMPMGTGGMIPPNTTATATSRPVTGNGVASRVSIGLFLMSVALTALLQM